MNATTFVSNRFATAAFALLLGTGIAQAGNVEVTVTDASGKPVPNVAVMVVPNIAGFAPALPAKPVVIDQRDLQFAPPLTVVRTGTTLRFVNRDPYDHHVRSVASGPLGGVAPAKDFEMRLGAAEGRRERSADIVADKAGVIGLGCHLHGSMRGHVFVVDTPYFAKTDEAGRATVADVPNGIADLRLWHAEQLADQPGQPVQVGASAMQASSRLNFTPKRRRGT